MQGVDNPVASFFGGGSEAAYAQRIFTYLHPYTVGCYSYYRLLVRICVLKTYPPSGVTSGWRAGHSRQQAELLTPLLGGILLAQLRKLPDS